MADKLGEYKKPRKQLAPKTYSIYAGDLRNTKHGFEDRSCG